MHKYPTLSLLSSFDPSEPCCQTLAMLQTLPGGCQETPKTRHQADHAVPQWKVIWATCSAEKQATEWGKGELTLQNRGSACGQPPASQHSHPTHTPAATTWVDGHPACTASMSKPPSPVFRAQGTQRVNILLGQGLQAQTMLFISNCCAADWCFL